MGIVIWWEKITPRWRIFEAVHLSLSRRILIWVGQIFLDPNFARICPCARVFQSRVLTRPRAEKPTNRHTGRDSAKSLLGCGTDKKVNDLVPYFLSLFTGQNTKTKQTQSTWFVRIWTCNIEIIAHPFDNVNGLSKICSRNNSAWTKGILDSCAVFRIATWRQPSAWQPKRNPDETHRARRGSLTQCGCLWSFAVWRSVALSA